MEVNSRSNYRLIEGQEKQSLLEKYINQPAEFDRSSTNLEVFHLSSNLTTTEEPRPNPMTEMMKSKVHPPQQSGRNNQERISSLSDLISRSKESKARQVEYQVRSEKSFSRENLAETIRSID